MIDAARIATQLERDGYVHVRAVMSELEFVELARTLGRIVQQTAIRIERSRSLLNSTARMDLHTDSPEAHAIAWYCVTPDAAGAGATSLVDTRPLPTELAPYVDVLVRTPVRCPRSRTELVDHACLEPRGRGWRVYYAPWLLQHAYDPEQRAALAALAAWIDGRSVVDVRLERGEALLVDNGRMLHGRAALPGGSPRHLTRLWLAS